MGRCGNHEKKNSPKWGVMDVILVFVAISLLTFTAVMVHIYVTQGGIPDTLCTCVFSVLGGECGIMGWIKTNKDKQQQRQWDKADKAESAAAERKDKENG